MARKPSSQDGRPRVNVTVSIAAKTHDLLMNTQALLKGNIPNAKIGQAIDSIADFAEIRRFDPIKVMKPVASFDTPTGNTDNPKG